MSKFQQLYLDIQKKISKLEIKIEQLTVENTALRNENIELKKENASLKEKLGLNSKNSSIPSSKELYKIKRANKAKSDRKQGAQLGHKGHSCMRMEANEIIKIDLDSRVM